ncbi:MAG: membrane protein insertion efficiency factor YidD [Phycisphaerales bacterium]|nr:membrane protein insertion efficiency factor YidD [Phycisphaerales bacterium]
MNLPWLGLLRLYQWTVSPLVGGHCRFVPTCSRYAQHAFRAYNPLTASWLTARRLARCHPWGGAGFDPVPDREDHRESPAKR